MHGTTVKLKKKSAFIYLMFVDPCIIVEFTK